MLRLAAGDRRLCAFTGGHKAWSRRDVERGHARPDGADLPTEHYPAVSGVERIAVPCADGTPEPDQLLGAHGSLEYLHATWAPVADSNPCHPGRAITQRHSFSTAGNLGT